MMNQPELGKKIAELRKTKDFTQEELVEMCNVSVRTLQRIESGEVMPRTSTVKLIFSALDYSYQHLFEPNNSKSGPFYKQMIDLFNLKTNTMKKVTILTIMVALVAGGVFAINIGIKAQNENGISKKIDDKCINESPKKRGMTFSYFCGSCFQFEGHFIARN